MRTESILIAQRIAETGSITRVAEMFYFSQPGISNQLKVLEDELGFPLFVRINDRGNPRKLVPTAQGKRWLSCARRALDELERGKTPDKRWLRASRAARFKVRVRKGDGL